MIRWRLPFHGCTSVLGIPLLASLLACSRSAPRGAVAQPVAGSPGVETAIAVVPVHVTYSLRALRPALDSLFPAADSLARASCTAARGLVCHQYVYRREPWSLRAQGPRLSIDTRLAYRAQVGAAGVSRLFSCGYAPESMRRAALTMATTLYWRRDWKIGAQNTTLNAELIDPCLVSVFGVNATNTLRDVINGQLRDFAASADTAIPRAADFRPLADSLWRSFLDPTPLDSLRTLWLVLDPQSVHVTSLNGDASTFRTAIVLRARPRIVAGSKPATQLKPLPVLSLGDAPREFDVPVTVELPFSDVERRALALLAAETKGTSVRVDSVHVHGSRDTVHIALDVSGVLRGRLVMDSRLRWDTSARELLLEGLDWNLESKGMLSRVKATLATPLIARAIRRGTMGGRVPLGAQLDTIRVEMMSKLNGGLAPGVSLGSSVTDLQITGVSAGPNAFLVTARLRGQSGVWIQ